MDTKVNIYNNIIMTFLLIFAFISGFVTILAPCIWPLLPIILSSTATGGHRKPLGIVIGIMSSFAIFTLAISYVVKIIPFDPNSLRLIAVIVIGFLGITLIIPKLSQLLEGYVSRLSGSVGGKFYGKQTNGFFGGLVTGFVLGLVWSPCAGPILATIATLAATQSLNSSIVLITIVYVTGIGIPLFLFATFGRLLFTRSRALSKYTGKIQQVFGVIMIITAIAIYTNFDKTLQVYLLQKFPAFDQTITSFEKNDRIRNELNSLKGNGSAVLQSNGLAPEFVGITNWINTNPLTMQKLRGKVVLIDFWTYTCINCIRTLPYITKWDEKYKNEGLVIIGVHTPEFEFEKNTENVKEAIEKYNIKYPVAQDNDYATWNAYSNLYWPAKYLIDANGNVRYTHFGEGNYDETEKAIQELLKEAGKSVNSSIEKESDQTPTKQISPETYLGSNRMSYLEPNGKVESGSYRFTLSKNTSLNHFSFGGEWDVSSEYSSSRIGSIIEYNFKASKVFLVMRPNDNKKKQVKVFFDGKLITENSGKDVENGIVTIDSDRLYDLINLKEIENHVLRLEFQNEGIEVFAFTFG